MDITPLDIRKQEFKKSFNGYDKNEVDNFLEMIAQQMEDLIRENMNQKEQLKDVKKQISDYRTMEKTLQDTLTSAQKTTEELRKNAKQEGTIIMRNAELEAKHILESAREESSKLRSEIKTLITLKNNFIAKFKGMIEAYARLLEDETLSHKEDVNDFNAVLKEPPENVTNIGSLFNKQNDDSDSQGNKDYEEYKSKNRENNND